MLLYLCYSCEKVVLVVSGAMISDAMRHIKQKVPVLAPKNKEQELSYLSQDFPVSHINPRGDINISQDTLQVYVVL